MKRDGFLFTVFLALISVILIHSMSGAADMKKVEKIIPVKRADILFVSLKIDAGEINVQKNIEPDQVLISVQYDDETDQFDIDFDEKRNELFISIDLDIGETSVSFPRDLGVRFESSTFGFLTRSSIDYEFDKKGRFYYSENYDSAARTMNISISSGIGELKVTYR